MGTGPRTRQDSCLPITAGTPGQVGWEGRAEPGTCEVPFSGVPDPLPSTSACSCSCPLSSLEEEAPGWHGFFVGSFLASKSSVTFDLKRLSPSSLRQSEVYWKPHGVLVSIEVFMYDQLLIPPASRDEVICQRSKSQSRRNRVLSL